MEILRRSFILDFIMKPSNKLSNLLLYEFQKLLEFSLSFSTIQTPTYFFRPQLHYPMMVPPKKMPHRHHHPHRPSPNESMWAMNLSKKGKSSIAACVGNFCGEPYTLWTKKLCASIASCRSI
jgi:hypothetical protein